jgi:hypothetical protein
MDKAFKFFLWVSVALALLSLYDFWGWFDARQSGYLYNLSPLVFLLAGSSLLTLIFWFLRNDKRS